MRMGGRVVVVGGERYVVGCARVGLCRGKSKMVANAGIVEQWWQPAQNGRVRNQPAENAGKPRQRKQWQPV